MTFLQARLFVAVGWFLIGISIINGDHGIALALSPSSPVALTSTVTALWSTRGRTTTASANISHASVALQSSNGETETTANAATTEEISTMNSTSPSTQSKLTTKVAELMAATKSSSKRILSSSQLQSGAAVFGGTILTYYLNNYTLLGPVKASSVVGIASALLLPLPLALAAFCGSFAGMAKPAVISPGGPSVVLGVVCAGMMALFDKQKWLVGVGGRLGFIAQCACTLQFVVSSLVLKQPVVSGSATSTLLGSFGDPLKVLGSLPAVCLSTVAGALFMSFWREAMSEQIQKKKDTTTVHVYHRLSNSVAAAGITGGLVATMFPPSVAGPAFCGSFIAMSAPAKLETYGSLIGASLMGGICQQAMSGVLLGGWGGRLGTAALLGVLSYNFLAPLRNKTLRPATASKPL